MLANGFPQTDSDAAQVVDGALALADRLLVELDG
jgi:hypothetical protein